MGDFFNEVVIFLEEYYVYVIGVGLILVLMLVGLLASKRKARKETKSEDSMANINDVNTGSINDVANTLQSDVMQPVDVVTFLEEKPSVISNESVAPIVPEAVPTSSMWAEASEPIAPIVAPTNSTPFVATPIVAPVSSTMVATPVASGIVNEDINTVKPIIKEIKPVDVDRFDKTEIIDFSSIEPAKPVDFKPFIIDKSQYADTDNILNGENSSLEEPKI